MWIAHPVQVALFQGFTGLVGYRIPSNGTLVQLKYVANRTNKTSRNWGPPLDKKTKIPANEQDEEIDDTHFPQSWTEACVAICCYRSGFFPYVFLLFINVLGSFHLENGSILTGLV